MGAISERFELTGRALAKLHELTVLDDLTEVERDALIQRFEFSFEILWKAAKDYLFEVDGIIESSPKKVIRACFEQGVLDEEETRQAIKMTDARNLTTHTYDEGFAEEMVTKVRRYESLMRAWYERMLKNL